MEPKDPKAFEVLKGNISTSGQCIKIGNLCLKFELTSIKICTSVFPFPPIMCHSNNGDENTHYVLGA